jgi:hypothetical protein
MDDRKITEKDVEGVPSAPEIANRQQELARRWQCAQLTAQVFSTHPGWQPVTFKDVLTDLWEFLNATAQS